jgi:hypothetical protein
MLKMFGDKKDMKKIVAQLFFDFQSEATLAKQRVTFVSERCSRLIFDFFRFFFF